MHVCFYKPVRSEVSLIVKVAGFLSGNRVPVDLYRESMDLCRFGDHKSGLLKIQFGDHKINLDFKRFYSDC